MSRLTNHTVRAGVSTVGVAAVLMALASTAQSPDGFIQASFGGPLNIFSDKSPQPDVVIGDGTADTSELAAILNGPLPQASPASPYLEAYEAGAGPLAIGATPAADPAAGAPTVKQSLGLPRKPVVDAMGRVDCTGAVSCKTDPNTQVTTVTYPDGAVALVQQINDMTVVAYKSLAETLQDGVESILPGVQFPGAASTAAPRPTATPSVVEAPATQTAAPTVDRVPAPDISASTVRPRGGSPRAQNPTNGNSGSPSVPGNITLPAVKPTRPADVVKDVINSVVNALTGHSGSQIKKPVQPPAPSGPAPETTSDTSGVTDQNSASDGAQ
jgi:hypothetical protein